MTVETPVDGDLYVMGGDVHALGGSLTVGPNAHIAGKLNFIGGDLDVDSAAVISGGTKFQRGSNWSGQRSHDVASRFSQGWGWTAFLVVLAALLATALPGATRGLTQELKSRPWQVSLVGFLAITAIPVFLVLMCITIIGIPVALLTAMLYAVLLLAGYVWLAVVIGGLLLDRYSAETAAVTAWRVGAAVAAVLVIAVLVRLPYLGGVLKFAVLAIGMGMIVGALVRLRDSSVAPIPPSFPPTDRQPAFTTTK